MTDQTQRDTEAAARIRAFLEARDRFATSARKQGVELRHPRLIDTIAQQPDTAAVVRFPGGLDVADRPGSASYPLNAADLRAVLAALDSAQGRVAELEREVIEAEDMRPTLSATEADLDEARADRDRLAARVAELETERERRAKLDRERWHSIAASIRNLSAHANGYEREAKEVATSDAGESGDRTDSLGRCRDCYGRGDDFEGGACSACGGTGAEASKPTPSCAPTPNALACACGGPVNHEGTDRDAV